MKLPAPAAGPAPISPAAPAAAPADDLNFGGEIPTDTTQPQAPSDDKPFDDEPFDAGVEADETTDPKKFIEQLTGKLGQSLRKYSETQGQPDFELEKFAINSLLSATHTSEMDEEDKNDIIKKVNTAGNDESQDSDMGDKDNTDGGEGNNNGPDNSDSGNLDFGGGQDDKGLEEYNIYENDENIFLKNPKKNNMFQPGSNDVLDENKPCWKGYEQIGMKDKNGKEVPNCVPIKENNLITKKKSSIFDKNTLKSKLQETFNQEDMSEPMVQPIVKPVTKPAEPATPSRKNKPFTIEPDTIPQPNPKALTENFGTEAEYEFNNEYNEAINNSKKQLNIKGLDEIKNLIDNDTERLKSIVHGIRKEIANMNIQNNMIAADDNRDTTWIFNVIKIDNKIYLDFNGTAK